MRIWQLVGRVLSCWRVFVVLLLSCFATLFVWYRPVPVAWTSEIVTGGTHPLGFTADGLLVCLDSPQKSVLRLRHAATGQVVKELPIGLAVEMSGKLTPDGDWAILHSQRPALLPQIFVVSTKDGQLRCPPIMFSEYSYSATSPNGRYIVACVPADSTNLPTWSIIDLENGQVLWPCEQHTVFSPDSQYWASLGHKGHTDIISFHALADGREVGRSSLPKKESTQPLHLGCWAEEGLKITYYSDASLTNDAGHTGTDSQTWTCPVVDFKLSEMSPDPFNYGHTDSRNHRVLSIRLPSRAGQFLISDQQGTVTAKIQIALLQIRSWLGIASSYDTQQYAWQTMSPKTGQLLGPPIPLEFPVTSHSPDGQWLVRSGFGPIENTLKTWKLPTRSRLPETLLAGSVPWLLLLWRRRKTAATQP